MIKTPLLTLMELCQNILAEIDGGEECSGRDSQLTQWVNTIEDCVKNIAYEQSKTNVAIKGAIAALSQNKVFPADIEAAKIWLLKSLD